MTLIQGTPRGVCCHPSLPSPEWGHLAYDPTFPEGQSGGSHGSLGPQTAGWGSMGLQQDRVLRGVTSPTHSGCWAQRKCSVNVERDVSLSPAFVIPSWLVSKTPRPIFIPKAVRDDCTNILSPVLRILLVPVLEWEPRSTVPFLPPTPVHFFCSAAPVEGGGVDGPPLTFSTREPLTSAPASSPAPPPWGRAVSWSRLSFWKTFGPEGEIRGCEILLASCLFPGMK